MAVVDQGKVTDAPVELVYYLAIEETEDAGHEKTLANERKTVKQSYSITYS